MYRYSFKITTFFITPKPMGTYTTVYGFVIELFEHNENEFKELTYKNINFKYSQSFLKNAEKTINLNLIQ